MNDVIRLLRSHRSIRKYSERPIDKELFDDIVLAGQAAATSSYIQATTIIRVTDQKKRKQLAKLAGDQPYVTQAAEFVVVCADWYRAKQQLVNLGDVDADFSWTEQFMTATIDAALFA